MSFSELEQAIVSPALKNVAKYWNELRSGRTMPAWSDIRPSAIVAQLPIIWCYTFDRETRAFTGRLAGDLIEQIFKRRLRGLPMSEAYPEPDYQRLYQRSLRVVTEPALYQGQGAVFRHVHQYGFGERIMLPLAADGALADALLGATDYSAARNDALLHRPDIEAWFSAQ